MAMGKRTPRQQTMWVNHSQLPKGKGHPFYTRLNELLAKDGFDAWAENLCAPFFANSGRPSIPPGVYFRMLFIGYLEGFASDRAIAWNCQDRLSLRAFLGIALHESTPDHSSLTIWRQRLSLDVYRAAFQRILALSCGPCTIMAPQGRWRTCIFAVSCSHWPIFLLEQTDSEC